MEIQEESMTLEESTPHVTIYYDDEIHRPGLTTPSVLTVTRLSISVTTTTIVVTKCSIIC